MKKRHSNIAFRILCLSFATFFAFAITEVYAPPIYVAISGKIETTVDYMNYSSAIYKAPQEIIMNIENTGSAGCKITVRADFYKDTTLLKTAWSEIQGIDPGGHFLFHNYWMPEAEGNITADIRIYQCQEISKSKRIWFFVSNSTIEETDSFYVTDSANTKDEINITIQSNKTLKNVFVIPRQHPLGWIVEPTQIDIIEQGIKKTATLKYEAGTWHPESLAFDIVAEDGKEYTTYQMQLKEATAKEEPMNKDAIIGAMLVLIIFLTTAIVKSKKKQGRKQTTDKPCP